MPKMVANGGKAHLFFFGLHLISWKKHYIFGEDLGCKTVPHTKFYNLSTDLLVLINKKM